MGTGGVCVENSRRNPSGLALGWGALVEMMWTDVKNTLKETLNALGNRRVNSIISKQSLLLGNAQSISCPSLAA